MLREAISVPYMQNNLRELTLSHNLLDCIPSELFYLVNLKVLLLVRNIIIYDRSFCNLKILRAFVHQRAL